MSATPKGHEQLSTSTRARTTAVPRRSSLADGRELIYFDDPTGHAESAWVRRDARRLGSRSPTGAMRYDALVDEWVSIASHRQSRTYLPPADNCPLCPSTEHFLSEIPSHDYDVAVFENRFPSFGPDSLAPGSLAPDSLGPDGSSATAAEWGVEVPANGRCEVISFSSDHTASFAALGHERAGTVIEAWAQRTRELSALPAVEQVFCFENRGEEIGVTLHHPHGQIYAYPYVTPRTRTMLSAARRWSADHGSSLLSHLLASELDDGRRIIDSREHWTAYVPFAARWPLEIHLVPHRQVPDLAALNDAEKDELARIYPRLLARLDGLYSTPTPYISAWHQAPTGADRELGYLHLQLTSPRRAEGKLKFLAGSEAAMGAFVNDVSPERIAHLLRGEQ